MMTMAKVTPANAELRLSVRFAVDTLLPGVAEFSRYTAMRIYIISLTVLALTSGCSDKSFRQNGSSAMSPTIRPNEDVVADMSAFRKTQPKRWDVVVFHPPSTASTQPQDVWAMRIIGLPEESLEIHEDGVYVDGTREVQPVEISNIRYVAGSSASGSPPTVSYPYKIPPESYFLVGDNTTNSFDSRFWGALPKERILGKIKNK